LRLHALWVEDSAIGQRAVLREANLRGADLSEANLSGAVLREADLRWADLRWAHLREAHLSEANLRGADLSGAILSEADLRRADLSRAILREANLSGAILSGAKLDGTILAARVSRWQWAQQNAVASRSVDGRSLALFQRSKVSQHITPPMTYEGGRVYTAPVFSRCPMTDCHPGLYVAGRTWDCGTDRILVAGWVDELEGPLTDKARLPLFRVLKTTDVDDRTEWQAITAADMLPGPGAPGGRNEEE